MLLNLKKIDYKNFKKQEQKEATYIDLNQNISRAWHFLKTTHRLKNGECLCLRSIGTATNKYDRWAGSEELRIYNFDYDYYEEFKNFMTKKVNSKRIYNFYYNIYNISVRRSKENLREKEKDGFFGTSSSVGTTSMMIIDLDNFTNDDYLKMKKDFENRGLIGTIDNMSGHGFQIIFRLKDNIEDDYLLLKFIKVLQENGYSPDTACQDCGRTMRLPFFYNQKAKYDTVALSELIDGEYSSRLFTVEEIFKSFGVDYNTFDLDQYYQKRKKQQNKRIEEHEEITYKNVNINDLYDEINIKELPVGIQNMLKGFEKGYANLQTMVLTIFFKRKGFSLDKIKEIIGTVELINGNDWNTIHAADEAERFYNKYDYINKYTLMDLERVFGEIKINYSEQMYRIPIGIMKPVELKIYTYLLLNKDKTKNEIIEWLGISRPTMNRIIKDCKYIFCNDKVCTINKDIKSNFIYVNEYFLNKILKLTEYQLSLYCYLYFRLGLKNEICTSIESIKKTCLFSEKTITNTIKELEQLEYIKVKRSKYNPKENKREQSNLYHLIK